MAGLDNKNLAPELRAFAEYMRELAARAELSPRQLASAMETTPSTLSRILTGRRLPSPKWLRQYQNWISQHTESGLSAEERDRGRELLFNAALTKNVRVPPGITMEEINSSRAVDNSAAAQLLNELRSELDSTMRGLGSAEPALTDVRPRLRAVPFGPPLTGPAGETNWGVRGQVDGRSVLATGGVTGVVRLWDPRAHSLVGDPLIGHDGPVNWGAWGRVDGRSVLATGGDDGSVWWWNPSADGATSGRNVSRAGSVWWGAWEGVGNQPVLATGGTDGSVRLWVPRAGRWLDTELTGHRELVEWGSWGLIDDQSVLATGGSDCDVRFWAPRADDPHPLTGHAMSTRWGAWGLVDDQPVLATGHSSGAVQFWDPRNGTRLGMTEGHLVDISWGAWGVVHDQPVLATGGYDRRVRLWDPRTYSQLGDSLVGHNDEVLWGTWGEVDGRPVLATGDGDGTVRMWEIIEDRPITRWNTYRSDVSESTDELARADDAVALAELVTARSARPPLAVGLFGDWGEGKSHFLRLLRDQVRAAARRDNTLSHDAVRQVWFNAWHYSETDLWASLVVELFAQLANPVEDGMDVGAEQRSQSRLAAELIAKRGLRERLAAARARRDELNDALRRVDPDQSWDALTDEQKQRLRDLGAADPEALYRKVVRTGAALWETGRGWWRFLRAMRRRHVILLGLWALLLVASTVTIAWGVPMVARWVATLPAAVTILTAVAVVKRMAQEARTRAWQAAVNMAERQQQRLRTAADVAAAEVVELEREVRDLTAAGQLAGLVSDRMSSGSYRGQLGVMTQIREDFQRMARLLAEADRVPAHDVDEVGDALPRIDRIVLYVDDLDRCPPHRVVEMLEAIHLLLAVELFVVVVAVDPRWLLRSIAAHYPDLVRQPAEPATMNSDLVDPDDEELWRSTPAQYLEKIFQVVLTLPPLDTSGYQRMLRTLVGTRADEPPPPPDLPAHDDTSQDTPPTPNTETTTQSEDDENTVFGVALPAARIVERVDPLTLDPDELALLDLLGPPMLVTTPRGVKRLANSYGLLTAIRRDHRADDLGEQQGAVLDAGEVSYYPYRAGVVLLGALVAYPAFGPAMLLHLHHADGRTTWTNYLDELTPTKQDAGWTNAADPTMTPVQATQWHALVTALRQVTTNAAARELPLPEPLSAWKEWIVPVGRLSFPAGRIVNTLDRHHPLDSRP